MTTPPTLSSLRATLQTFTHSSAPFKLLTSIPAPTPTSPSPAPRTLFILDSSFNPPTRAHFFIALSALLSPNPVYPSPRRLLLLLATNNADKAATPATFEQRLMMMHILASELRDTLVRDQAPSTSSSADEKGREKDEEVPGIDIGLTTHPYFTSKSTAIAESGAYPSNPTHIHLIGFDTLIRLLDPKYYPPTLTLSPLAPFFARHRVRVTSRPGASWGEDSAQESYIQGIGEGSLDGVGGEKGWRHRIERVDGREGAGVSSSRVRQALGQGGEAGELVTEGVREWILKEGLYRDGK